jgi:hypothetical protein
MANIHYGDIGTDLEVIIKNVLGTLDVSGATVKQIVLGKPSRVAVVKDAAFVTDGTDGLIHYVTIANDLDEVGVWRIQGYVVLPDGAWHTSVEEFDVLENI